MDVEEGEAKTCRLCGQNERFYVDVFGEEGVRRYLGLRIHRNINILIKTDDSMPQQICRLCLEKLNFTCAFYDNCHEIQKKLIWSTIEEANDENNVEDKENTISSRNGIKRQIRTLSENLRKETHLTNTDSLIIDVHIWAHLNIKPYKCKKCSFSTVTPSNIRCHIRKSHLKIKPFACKLCPKQYATFALLKEHDNIHIGVRPYKCEMCGFSSTNRQALRNHMGTHMSARSHSIESILSQTNQGRIPKRGRRILESGKTTIPECQG